MSTNQVNTLGLARTIFTRFRETCATHNYSEILALQALARMGTFGEPVDLDAAIKEVSPFLAGKIEKISGAFSIYRTAGNGSAWLLYKGYLPEHRDALVRAAEDLVNHHPRSATGAFRFPEGAFGQPERPEALWIDAAWAVCPFLTHVGLAAGRTDLVDEAIRQITVLRGLLLDGTCGLFHQAIGFSGPGVLSMDHWSRGNGWAAVALSEIACELPGEHPMASAMKAVFVDFLESCLKCQDEKGLWHQEMTRHGSFVEISGTTLILYALGRALEKNMVPELHRIHFKKGLESCLGYISVQGDVDGTCIGCCSPGDGSIEAYEAHSWKINDPHGFGSAMLAFSQAHILGLTEVGGRPTGRLP